MFPLRTLGSLRFRMPWKSTGKLGSWSTESVFRFQTLQSSNLHRANSPPFLNSIYDHYPGRRHSIICHLLVLECKYLNLKPWLVDIPVCLSLSQCWITVTWNPNFPGWEARLNRMGEWGGIAKAWQIYLASSSSPKAWAGGQGFRGLWFGFFFQL